MITTLTQQTYTTTLDAGVLVTTLVSGQSLVSTVSVPGPQGPKGNTGESVTTQTHKAGANLSGHRAIRVSGGLAHVADGTNAAHAGRCIGISTGAAVQGDDVTVQTAGAITEPGWTWTDGPVFVGADGILMQSLAGLAFVQQIGVATSATSIDINPQLPILIS